MPVIHILSASTTPSDRLHLLRFPDPGIDLQHGDPPGYRTGFLVLAMFFVSVIGGMIGKSGSNSLKRTSLTVQGIVYETSIAIPSEHSPLLTISSSLFTSWAWLLLFRLRS